jgi:ABC-type lipoprotein export system ATPase subunit
VARIISVRRLRLHAGLNSFTASRSAQNRLSMSLLRLTGLSKSYPLPGGGERRVVEVGEFALAAGAQMALRGESGSGKTTFLHLIAGILAPDHGRVELAGRDMAALGEAARDRLRAENIGYIFQTFNLLQGHTVLENVELGMAFGRGVDRAHAESLLKRVGLGDRLGYFPRQLSTGQQQRVAVARALANRPKLVLADEPTGNLDARNSREALALIREVCRENGAALLLVSHDEGVLAQFENVQDFATLNRAMENGGGAPSFRKDEDRGDGAPAPGGNAS